MDGPTVRGICMGCGQELLRDRIEITTLSDDVPRFIDGQWDVCCGTAVALPAPSMGPLQDVPVPTPTDLLRGAGLWVGLP